MNTKEKILKILDDFGMTGVKAAEAMGIAYSTFRKNENEIRHNFNEKNHQKLVEFIVKKAIEIDSF